MTDNNTTRIDETRRVLDAAEMTKASAVVKRQDWTEKKEGIELQTARLDTVAQSLAKIYFSNVSYKKSVVDLYGKYLEMDHELAMEGLATTERLIGATEAAGGGLLRAAGLRSRKADMLDAQDIGPDTARRMLAMVRADRADRFERLFERLLHQAEVGDATVAAILSSVLSHLPSALDSAAQPRALDWNHEP